MDAPNFIPDGATAAPDFIPDRGGVTAAAPDFIPDNLPAQSSAPAFPPDAKFRGVESRYFEQPREPASALSRAAAQPIIGLGQAGQALGNAINPQPAQQIPADIQPQNLLEKILHASGYMAPVITTGGATGAAIAGATGAGEARGDVATRRAQGQDISGAQEAGYAGVSGALNAAVAAITGQSVTKLIPGRDVLGRVVAQTAIGTGLGDVQQRGSNLVARETGIDPEREISQGTREARIMGGTMGAGFGLLHPGEPRTPVREFAGQPPSPVERSGVEPAQPVSEAVPPQAAPESQPQTKAPDFISELPPQVIPKPQYSPEQLRDALPKEPTRELAKPTDQPTGPVVTRGSRHNDIIYLSFDGMHETPSQQQLQEQIRSMGFRVSVNKAPTDILTGASGNVAYRIDVEPSNPGRPRDVAEALYRQLFGHDNNFVNESEFERRAPAGQRLEAARLAGMKHETGLNPTGQAGRERLQSQPPTAPEAQTGAAQEPGDFYKRYPYQHTLLRGADEATINKLVNEGFQTGVGPNATLATRGEASNIMEKKWGTKAGSTVLALPQDAIVDSPNGPKIKPGYKPSREQFVTINRDFEPMHEAYARSREPTPVAAPAKGAAQEQTVSKQGQTEPASGLPPARATLPKEPWEMTREEFFNNPDLVRASIPEGRGGFKVSYRYTEPQSTGPFVGSTILPEAPKKGSVIPAMYGKAKVESVSKAKPAGMDNMQLFEGGKKSHRASVEQALREGKIQSHPDYPDLAKSAPPAEQAAPMGGKQETIAKVKPIKAKAPMFEGKKAAEPHPAYTQSMASKNAGESPPKPIDTSDMPISVSPDDISYDLAYRAHAGTSMVPEDRARSRQREYVQHMRGVYDELAELAKTPEQKAALAAEMKRYQANYLLRYRALLSGRSKIVSTFIAGPSKFPARQMNKRSDADGRRTSEFVEWDKRAQAAMRKTIAPETSRVISSDDPNAADLLHKKLDSLKQDQERMRLVNAAHKKFLKDPASLESSGLTPAEQSLVKNYKPAYSWEPHPYPPYALQNNNANIKRVELRIGNVTRQQAVPESESTFEGGKIVENAEANRLQIIFDAKPNDEVRAKLKQAGFRWTPSEGAWQRQRTNNAREAAQRILGIQDQPSSEPPNTLGKFGAGPAGITGPEFTTRDQLREPPTSIKNRVAEVERAVRGLPAAEQPKPESQKRWLEEAKAEHAENPGKADRLIAELAEHPRALGPREQTLIELRTMDLQQEYDRVSERINKRFDEHGAEPTNPDVRAEMIEDRFRWSALSDQLLQAHDVAKKSGSTETARGLASRKMMIAQDFSLAAMETQMRAAKGGEKLSASEHETIRKLRDELTATQKAFDEYIAGSDKKLAEERLLSADFQTRKSVKTEAIARRLKGDVSTPEQREQKILSGLRQRVADGAEKSELGSYIQRLFRNYVERGGRGRNAGVDEVHAAVAKIIPDISRREVMDSISGYGEYRPLSKDEISATVRDLKGQLQQVGKLEDMAAGKAPVKTGFERRTPSEAEKELIKIVNEAKKEGGYNVTDPETQLKSALQSYKTRTTNRIAELEQKIKVGDYSTKPRTELKLDTKAQMLKAQLERYKQKFQDGLLKVRMSQRTLGEKAQDTFVKWRRAFLLSDPATLLKLTSAAVQRMAITPIEEAVGAGIGKIVPGVASKAVREGGLHVKAEAKAITEGFTAGMADAWQILKTGKSDLDVLYGASKRGEMPHEAIDFIGSLHGALKAQAKRNEFARSFEKRVAAAMRAGLDVTEPMIQTHIAVAAYKDANRAIFSQDNRVVSAYKRALSALDEKSKETGRVPFVSKIGSTALKTILPIVKIPTNIVAETMQYAMGSVTGSLRLARAYARGIETLKPAEADLIMRSLKKGSLGLAVLGLGYFNAGNIGGYYQPGKKRDPKDVAVGGVRIFGHDIPRLLVHNPLLEMLQIGATIRRVADSKRRKKDTETQGVTEGAIAASLGLVEEVPFAREAAEFGKVFNPYEREAVARDLAKSVLVPRAISRTAEMMDKDAQGNPIKRKPKTTWQAIESGIPGLRKKVPVG